MDKNLRIVYMGTPDFAVEPLKKLVEAGYNVVAVVTVPDKKAGRGQKIQMSAVKKYALELSIPVYQPENLKDEDWLEQYCNEIRPDLSIVVAFRMLPKVVWAYPRLGTFNLHASLLPMYRGAAPINWAVINGDTKSGVTTFFLDEKIDTGRIIMQKDVTLEPDETAGTLHDKLMYLGAETVLETVEKILQGEKGYPQTESSDAARAAAPKIFREDCKIDWNQPATAIYNKIRGLSPYPAAWCDFDETTAKVLKAEISDTPLLHSSMPGTMIIESGKLYFAASDALIEIKTIQVAGSRSMAASDFLRGYRR